MAVTNEQLMVQIGLDTSNASKSLDVLTKELIGFKSELKSIKESTNKSAGALSGFGATMVGVSSALNVAKIAFNSVVGAIRPMIGEFTDAQDGSKKLANMLQLFGDYSDSALSGFKDWAGTLQETTQVSDDLAIQLATTAKAMGLSNDQAKKMVETATDLAAVTGDSVEQSFQGLAMTLKGNARGLGEMGILLSDLTEKQLQAGDGIKRVSEIFKGQGAASLDTFSGQLKYATNMFGELMEAMGGIIVESLGLKNGTSLITNSFKDMTKWVNENKDEIIAWGKTITATIDGAVSFSIGVLKALEATAEGLFGLILKSAQGLGFVLNKVGAVSDENYQRMKENADNMLGSATEAANVTGEAFKDAFDTSKYLADSVEKTGTAVESAGKKFKGMGFGLKDALKEVEGIIKDLEKKVLDANKNITSFGATEAQTVEAKRIAAQGELDIIEKKLKDLDQLKGKQLELLKLNRDLANTAAAKELGAIQKKNMDDLISKNQELFLTLNQDQMIQNDLIDAQTKMLLEQLDIKTKNLALDEAGKQALAEQQKLIKASGEKQKKEAGSTTFQQMSKTGKDIGKNITDAFKSGAMDFIGGLSSMLSGIMGAVDAVIGIFNAILDFIPHILDSVSGLLNKITDLPNVILESVKGLGAAIVRFVGEFIPNLLKAIPEIIMSLLKALYIELPKVFVQMIKSLPGIIIGVINSIVDNIDEIVAGIISAVPEMAIAFTETFIKNAPRIAFLIAKAIAIEVPKAILKGIVEGWKAIWNSIKSVFGKGVKVQVDTKAVSTFAKDIGKKLSGVSQKLFAVMDLENSKLAADKAAMIEEAVTSGINKIKGVWQQLIDGLVNAWRWVYDNIIAPIFNALKAVWMWVYDKIVMPLINGLTAVWQWVNDKIVQPLLNGIRAAFQWVVDKVLAPMAKIVSAAFGWVVDNILTPIFNIVQSAFSWVIDNVITPMAKLGEKIAKPITDAFASVTNIFTGLFDGLKKLFKFDFSGAGKALKAVFSEAFDFAFAPLKLLMNTFVDVLNALALPQVDVSGSILGKDWSFTLIPGMDLIPGEIARFAAGGLVGAGTDTVPAMLTPGEFVVNRGAVNSLGMGAMNAINNGVAPVQNTTVNIEMKIDTTEPVDESFVRNKLMPKLKDELRRASLDGQFILSAKGVR
jgi:phage-related protein